MSHDSEILESSSAFFEAKYRHAEDPWKFSSNPYELRRYDAIVAAIAHRRYQRAFEPGCSIGVLTERLAGQCDKVYAIDFSPSASLKAKARCAHLPHVEIRCASIKDDLPSGGFDLLILSEIGYYFSEQEWSRLIQKLMALLHQGATVLVAHWLGHSEDHRISGESVHSIVLSQPGLLLEHSERSVEMRLDRLVRL